MGRRYINQLGHQEAVDDIYVASGKQLRPNRNGNLYLQVELSDRTGKLSARMWNASESIYRGFDDGDYVHIEGTSQLFQGAMQLIATRITKADPGEVDPTDFMTQSPADNEVLCKQVAELLRSLGDKHLRSLAEQFLADKDLMQRFARAPAAIKHHHAYVGGLLEHVAKLMQIVERIKDLYPQIDRDLLLLGVFLHDLGKVDELDADPVPAYTDRGQLVGHMVIACEMLDEKIRETETTSGEAFPREKALRLKHMIVSHHGTLEFGSPKVPMTLEAIALHYLDSLDAKLQSFSHLINDDPNVDSAWTVYNPGLGRKLFKGQPSSR